MKKKYLLIPVMLSLCLTSCAQHNNNNSEYGTISTEVYDKHEKETTTLKSEVGIISPEQETDAHGKNNARNAIHYDTHSGKFMDLPIYYQQDYPDTELGNSTIAKQGNLITCLSIMDSYLTNTFTNPVSFTEKYSQYIQQDMTERKITLLDAMTKDTSSSYIVSKFDLEKIVEYLEVDHSQVLLEINHPSIYCNTSTYLLLVGHDTSGNFEVRDPNYFNVQKFNKSEDTETVKYSITSICATAGNSSTVYVFLRGVPAVR